MNALVWPGFYSMRFFFLGGILLLLVLSVIVFSLNPDEIASWQYRMPTHLQLWPLYYFGEVIKLGTMLPYCEYGCSMDPSSVLMVLIKCKRTIFMNLRIPDIRRAYNCEYNHLVKLRCICIFYIHKQNKISTKIWKKGEKKSKSYILICTLRFRYKSSTPLITHTLFHDIVK